MFIIEWEWKNLNENDQLTWSETHSLLSKSKPSALTSATRFGGGHDDVGTGQCDADRGHNPLQRNARGNL